MCQKKILTHPHRLVTVFLPQTQTSCLHSPDQLSSVCYGLKTSQHFIFVLPKVFNVSAVVCGQHPEGRSNLGNPCDTDTGNVSSSWTKLQTASAKEVMFSVCLLVFLSYLPHFWTNDPNFFFSVSSYWLSLQLIPFWALEVKGQAQEKFQKLPHSFTLGKNSFESQLRYLGQLIL